MRIHILLTDDQGRLYEGEVSLTRALEAAKAPRPARSEQAERSGRPTLDFNLPLRALMTRHTRGLSGPQKFTLLVAALAKGKSGVLVSLEDIKKHWNRMKEPMGGPFRPVYSIRAKGNGWVDTPKRGFYVLHPGWMDALGAA